MWPTAMSRTRNKAKPILHHPFSATTMRNPNIFSIGGRKCPHIVPHIQRNSTSCARRAPLRSLERACSPDMEACDLETPMRQLIKLLIDRRQQGKSIRQECPLIGIFITCLKKRKSTSRSSIKTACVGMVRNLCHS